MNQCIFYVDLLKHFLPQPRMKLGLDYV